MLRDINILIPEYFFVCRDNDYIEKTEKDCFGVIYKENGDVATYKEYMKAEKNPPQLFRSIYEK